MGNLIDRHEQTLDSTSPRFVFCFFNVFKFCKTFVSCSVGMYFPRTKKRFNVVITQKKLLKKSRNPICMSTASKKACPPSVFDRHWHCALTRTTAKHAACCALSRVARRVACCTNMRTKMAMFQATRSYCW